MTKEAMQQLIKKELSKKLGDDFNIIIHEVLKTNVKLDGLTILKRGENISPTIYLEPYYSKLERGEEILTVVREIIDTYFQARVEKVPFDMNAFYDFNKMKDKLFVKLINKHFNEELLEDIPHKNFLDDFAITVHCHVDTKYEGTASFAIHKNHLNMWNVEEETLITMAIANTRRLFGLELKNMAEIISELNPEEVGEGCLVPMWVMTNTPKLFGATAVLFDDVLQNFVRMYGDFYVIFSSVHEVLLIPASDNTDIDMFSEMNKEVNAAEVNEDEVLGTKAYFYSQEKGFLLPERV